MKGKPKIGIFYLTASAAMNPDNCIPVKKYREKYFLTLPQIKRMLAKKTICGIRFKRRLYIADHPPIAKV